MHCRLVSAAGWILCLTALAGARQDRAADPPQFRSGIELIQLDVSVIDRDRRPVRGLTSGDFTVLIDGQPRPVTAYKSVELPPPPPPPSALWMKDVAPDVVTNARPTGRVVAIVIDDGSFGVPRVADLFAIGKAREVARAAVEELGPEDVAAVLFTENLHAAQNFTKDQRLLLNAIDGAALFPSSDADLGDPYGLRRPSCHCGACSIEALGQIAAELQSLPQQRKVVVYVSAGVLVVPQVFVPYNTIGNTDAIYNENCNTLKQRLMMEVFRRASLANVTIQAVDVRGLLATDRAAQPADTGGIDLRIQYLQAMAEETGGRAVVRNNDMERAVRPLIEESSFYYLLGVEAPRVADDGRLHAIQVRVNRPDVEVRTRRGYYAPTPEERKRLLAIETGDVAAAMTGPLPKTDLPLEINVVPIADPTAPEGSSLAVIVGITRQNEGTRVARSETVRVMATAFNPETGQSVGSHSHELNLRWNATDERTGRFEVFSRLPLKAGRYEIRVGVEVEDGLSGSVYTYAEIPDFRKDELSLSGLLLNVTPSPRAAPVDAFHDVLPLVPTTRRTFRTTDRVTAWLRFHRPKDAPGTVTTRLTNADNDVIAELTEVIDTAREGNARAAEHRIDLPVEDLTPGEYLVTVEVSAGDDRARRDARFRIQ
jgi:VWFA-related protein